MALGLCAAPGVARACSCAAPPWPERAFQDSDAVFEARPFSMSSDSHRARYSFEVDRVWKGDIRPRVEVVTAVHSATCGRRYEVGTKYLVYAQRNKDGEWTDNLCSRTRTSQAAAEDLQVLGAGHPPVDPRAVPSDSEDGAGPTEPPRIEVPPVEPPPASPRTRGCAVEKPHTTEPWAWLVWLGLLAIGRRRAVRS